MALSRVSRASLGHVTMSNSDNNSKCFLPTPTFSVHAAPPPPGEVRERESSIKVFQTSNSALQQQLEALQRQLASPEATTPSFVAKQRQQLAAAANAHAGLQVR